MKNKIEIAILGSICISLIAIIILNLPLNPSPEAEIEFIQYEQEMNPKLISIIQYNLSEINQEIIETTQKYFEDIDFGGFVISYKYFEWHNSYYNDGGEIVVIGLSDITTNSERYRLVLTHEYMHYILHQYGLEDSIFHEGIADAYTIFLNRRAQGEIWGLKNEDRNFPYTIFTNQILEENNFDCLYKVFDENNKMSDFEEILARLEEWCNVSYKLENG